MKTDTSVIQPDFQFSQCFIISNGDTLRCTEHDANGTLVYAIRCDNPAREKLSGVPAIAFDREGAENLLTQLLEMKAEGKF